MLVMKHSGKGIHPGFETMGRHHQVHHGGINVPKKRIDVFQNVLKTTCTPCCFRGVHLKDLVLLHTALPDKMDGNIINFRKMAQLSIIFSELMKVQTSSLPVEPNMDMASMIRVSTLELGQGKGNVNNGWRVIRLE